MNARILTISACAAAVLIASGCGSVSKARKIDYRNTPTLPSLEVPPDLSALPEPSLPGAGRNTASGSATYSGFAGEQREQAPQSTSVLPRYANVQLAREGQTRFVVVKAEPAAVWDQVREFLTNTGLSITSEDPKAGLLETDWAENRALVGAGKKNVVAKWMASFYSVGTRDKYKVRLERGATPGTTEIYLRHKGMQETEPDKSDGARAGWEPRPSDPDLEAEMLQRLVVHLGGERGAETVVARDNAAAPTSAADPSPPSALLTRNGSGAPLLALEDSVDRAWRRVGLSLDRMGFTVEDRDRSKGIYYVRYIDPETQQAKKGFFSRLFTSDEPAPPNQFQVQVKPAENGTNVEVLNQEGDPATSKTGERILSLLYEQLK